MESSFCLSNRGFLELADQFNFRQADKPGTKSSPEAQENFGDILVQISKLQEEIGCLKSSASRENFSQKYSIVCQVGYLDQLTASLDSLANSLQLISRDCSSIENKLVNPVLGNSIPLSATNHRQLIDGTADLVHIVSQASSLVGSAEWICNQDWSTLNQHLVEVSERLESAASKFRSACFSIRQIRNIESSDVGASVVSADPSATTRRGATY